MSRTDFRDAARDQRVCAITGQGGAFHAHHVCRAQDVRKLGANPDDPRNALRLTWKAHFNHHHAFMRVPLRALTDENIEYAYELLGENASAYLRRHYSGDDPRLQSEDGDG